MAQIIRAVYEHGQLRPLDPLALTDGQEIRLAILSEQEQVWSALADMLAPVNAEPADEMDEAALVTTIRLGGAPRRAARGSVTAYFLDRSALVKRYVPEPGTAWVRTNTTPSAGDTILVAQMIPAEASPSPLLA